MLLPCFRKMMFVQRPALGLSERFCLFCFRSSSWNSCLAWQQSSCSTAHQPVEMPRTNLTKPDWPNAGSWPQWLQIILDFWEIFLISINGIIHRKLWHLFVPIISNNLHRRAALHSQGFKDKNLGSSPGLLGQYNVATICGDQSKTLVPRNFLWELRVT